ncbi:uncharacterized protein LOC131161276 [Malania oleifera]|uniref:uncharacterized protein LOC131161276 n=1 Tax=Malania oleifera TaxID=397392 RepID=UPI0025AEA7E5|nr:uncharacterized protein LOC131161276 [Malania oleifera]
MPIPLRTPIAIPRCRQRRRQRHYTTHAPPFQPKTAPLSLSLSLSSPRSVFLPPSLSLSHWAMETARPELDSSPSPLKRAISIDSPANTRKLCLPTKPHHPNGPTVSSSSSSSPLSSSSFTASSASFPTVDFELVSLKSLGYTSLKDLIPSSSVQSPTAASASAFQISIRNRLVKQAAWAYLQPMSSSPAASAFRFPADYFRNPLSGCLDFLKHHIFPTIARVFDRLFRAIRFR